MGVRIVRLAARSPGEGTRMAPSAATARRPKIVARGRCRGSRAQPSTSMKLGLAAKTPAQWNAFSRKYLAEMAATPARDALALLAALSHGTDFSVGCYCEDEARCHRSLLRRLLAERGADIAALTR
jgi:hypothetical protein